MKPFETLFPDLLPLVPGCPEPVAERALLRATQRFCELTRCWRVVLDDVGIYVGADEYDLDLPEFTEIVRIESALFDGRSITVAGPGARLGRSARYIETTDGRTLHINPLPTGTSTLRLTATLKPSDQAPGIEAFIAERYAEVIALGAAARLKQQPQKSYSAPDGLSDWQAFEARCATINITIWRGLGNTPARTIPSWF